MSNLYQVMELRGINWSDVTGWAVCAASEREAEVLAKAERNRHGGLATIGVRLAEPDAFDFDAEPLDLGECPA